MGTFKKIGIMGGTFNPIHMGHLILGEQAYEQFKLDKIYFMPSKKPPHKDHKNIIPDILRKDMISLAIKGNPHFQLSTIELDREGITYTVDTLEYLKKKEKMMEFYFIIGADSLFQLETWRNPKRVFELTTMLVATRYQLSENMIMEQINYLKNTYKANIELLEVPTIDISSKHIRECCRNIKSIRYYVPDEVNHFIQTKELYSK